MRNLIGNAAQATIAKVALRFALGFDVKILLVSTCLEAPAKAGGANLLEVPSQRAFLSPLAS